VIYQLVGASDHDNLVGLALFPSSYQFKCFSNANSAVVPRSLSVGETSEAPLNP